MDGHKCGATAQQALAGGAETRDRGGDVAAGRIGLDRGAPAQCERDQVFSWRRRFDVASEPAAVRPSSGLPVTIMPEPENSGAAVAASTTSKTIEIEVAGDCRVHVGAAFDARALKRVLDVLRKR